MNYPSIVEFEYMKQSTIIPIASGKGGVGKSFLGANLSIALAQFGHDTVVIDLDFWKFIDASRKVLISFAHELF